MCRHTEQQPLVLLMLGVAFEAPKLVVVLRPVAIWRINVSAWTTEQWIFYATSATVSTCHGDIR